LEQQQDLEQQRLALALQQGNAKALAAAKHLSKEQRQTKKSSTKRELADKGAAAEELKDTTKAAEDAKKKKDQLGSRNSAQTERRKRATAKAKANGETETPAKKRYKKELAATALNFALIGRGTARASANAASKARTRLAKLDDAARTSYGVLFKPLLPEGASPEAAEELLSEGYTRTLEGFFKRALQASA